MKQGLNMEKLLLERVMLRKELKLRKMQERLLDQTQKLEEAEEKIAEYSSLPGIELAMGGEGWGRLAYFVFYYSSIFFVLCILLTGRALSLPTWTWICQLVVFTL